MSWSSRTPFATSRIRLPTCATAPSCARHCESRVATLRRGVELANERYENGYSDYLEVLDTERSLFSTPSCSWPRRAAITSGRWSIFTGRSAAIGPPCRRDRLEQGKGRPERQHP
jgi:hypothetical protein